MQELEQRVYDIILMDVHMPIIDGLEASRRIRDTYPPEERPKIVALSADTTQVRAQQCCGFMFLSWCPGYSSCAKQTFASL